MYLIGKRDSEHRFKLIYGIFKDESKANSYLKSNDKDLSITKFENLNFPFFIIEELETTHHIYHPIDKEDLKKRIRKIKQVNDSDTVHFNLWKISDDGYNNMYPKDPFLNGRDWHLHFTNQTMLQIETDGFDTYWNDLLNA